MPLITKEDFTKNSKNNQLQEKTISKYSFFTKGGKEYFQIDTYGSKTRKNPNKVSQTIQLDKEMAQYLINILKVEFNLD